jgi:hypothetical protein
MAAYISRAMFAVSTTSPFGYYALPALSAGLLIVHDDVVFPLILVYRAGWSFQPRIGHQKFSCALARDLRAGVTRSPERAQYCCCYALFLRWRFGTRPTFTYRRLPVDPLVLVTDRKCGCFSVPNLIALESGILVHTLSGWLLFNETNRMLSIGQCQRPWTLTSTKLDYNGQAMNA